MAQFSLDDIRAAADKKYGAVEITFGDERVLRLINPLRLHEDRRNKLIKLQDELDAALQSGEGSQSELLAGGIRLVASDEDTANAFLAEVDGDLALLAQIFATYTDGTQAGEA